MKFKHGLCWIRRDLRLEDHAALAQATSECKNVTVIFVFDTTILSRLKDQDDKRVTFIKSSLKELNTRLMARGSSLLLRRGDPGRILPQIIKKLGCDALFVNRDYEPSAKERDKKVQTACKAQGVPFFSFKDQVIFEGREVVTLHGEPYRVFTPYKNAWLEKLKKEDMLEKKVLTDRFTPKAKLKSYLQQFSYENLGFRASELWLSAGREAALKRLKNFSSSIDGYKKNRDFPSHENGTSGLSVHLRFGTISIRELVRFAREHRSEGANTWLSELIWRDFYQMILDQFPYVVTGCFKQEYDRIHWPGSEDHFEAWKEGITGFPLVDAAMRHFKKTGWMHNRLRMVVASFLTKDLLVDWKKGEAWFAQKLLDFDLAANNGGWQWAASTGCDAQPYFRIFNPVTQSKKFDPDGIFIRENIEELEGVGHKFIHWPYPPVHSSSIPQGYGPFLVNHSVQRLKAMMLFKRKSRA